MTVPVGKAGKDNGIEPLAVRYLMHRVLLRYWFVQHDLCVTIQI
jgi:hypothetical protein